MNHSTDVQKLNAGDYRDAPFEKVILPLGSLESHGPHMPFGTDAFTASLLAMEVAKRLPRTAVLPALAYGVSEHYRNFSFTISLRSETEIAVLCDIFESLHREGIRKVFILNGHDGNIAPVEIAARTSKVKYPDFRIVSLDAWWETLSDLLPSDFFEVWGGLGHGGEGEISMGLALFPDLCHPERAVGIVPRLPPHVDVKWLFSELTDCGATGDPSKGTREKGQAMKEILVDTIVQLLKDLDNCDWDYRSPCVKR